MNEPRGVRIRNVYAIVLLVIGSFQMVGYLSGLKSIRGLGAVSTMSPFPKVFSDVKGFETFAADFLLLYESADGRTVETPITPEFYQRLEGAYNRRNVYGAALSYGPRLPREIWETIFCYALASDGPFRTEFGVPEDATGIRVRITEKTRGRDGVYMLEPECDN